MELNTWYLQVSVASHWTWISTLAVQTCKLRTVLRKISADSVHTDGYSPRFCHQAMIAVTASTIPKRAAHTKLFPATPGTFPMPTDLERVV
jgi:hypothetical protein